MDQTVTIAIASYNNAPYIERCVESVINQTYSDLEILVVDDGSQDDTLRRLENFNRETRLKIIKKENGGLSSVRQLALEQATGNYICFIDADDYLMPNYIEKMLNKLILDNSDICVCSSVFVTETGDRLDRCSFICRETLKPEKTTASEFGIINNPRIKNCYLSDSWNKLYKTTFLKDSGVKFKMPKGLNGTDTLFNRLVALHAPCYSVVQDELYIHVIYSKSAVHRKKKDLFSTYRIIMRESILESRRIGIYDEIKGYLEYKYASNLSDVLIDESKESLGYFAFLKRLLELKKNHLSFAREYGINVSGMSKNNIALVKIILFTFHNAIFALPLVLSLGKGIRKIIKS